MINQPIDNPSNGSQQAAIAFRLTKAPNSNHHIWNNNGTWWLHYTLHLTDYTKRRVRESLRTTDEAEARRLRDAKLASLRFAT